MKWRISALVLAGSVVGCASPTVVSVRQPGDANMSCEQLKSAWEDAGEFERQARKERNVTGTNVAAAVFFWPALVATYSNTADAIDAAKERQRYLMRLADGKKCPM
jgi:hypothetical protein